MEDVLGGSSGLSSGASTPAGTFRPNPSLKRPKIIEITRDLPLLPLDRHLRASFSEHKLRRAAAQVEEALPPAIEDVAPGRQPEAADASDVHRQEVQKQLHQAGRSINAKLAPAFAALGLTDEGNAPEHAAEYPVLRVRFRAITRWRGKPEMRPSFFPLTAPSPVTSLVTLVSSVVAGHENGHVFVWDLTGRSTVPLHQFEAHQAPVTALSYYPRLDTLATTGVGKASENSMAESQLRLWSCSTFRHQQNISLNYGSSARCLQYMELKNCESPNCMATAVDTRLRPTIQVLRFCPPKPF